MGLSIGIQRKTTPENVKREQLKYGVNSQLLFTKNRICYTIVGNYDKTAVICYGIADLMEDCYFIAKEFSQRNKINIVLFDYPGYGVSEGVFRENSSVEALREVVLATNAKFLIGFSIGTGVILSFMANYKKMINKVILISAFSSLAKKVKKSMIFEMIFEISLDIFTDAKFKNFYNIEDLDCEILAIYSDNDKEIDKSHGEILKRHNDKIKLIIIKDPVLSHIELIYYIAMNLHNFKPQFFLNDELKKDHTIFNEST